MVIRDRQCRSADHVVLTMRSGHVAAACLGAPRGGIGIRAAIAAVLLVGSSTAMADHPTESWVAKVTGNVIGQVLQFTGSKRGDWIVPAPSSSTLPGHDGIAHDYGWTSIEEFSVILKKAGRPDERVWLTFKDNYGKVSAPKPADTGFSTSYIDDPGVWPNYTGYEVSEVWAVGSHTFVPEPETYALILAGLGAVVWRRFYKRQ